MEEENNSPDFVKMELVEVQGSAKAAKNMTDRRFKKFEADMQEVIKEGRYNKNNHQLIKDLKRDMEENIVDYEDILTYLDSVYSEKAEKYTAEIADLTKNFKVIAQRRSTMRSKVKKDVAAVEEEKTENEKRVNQWLIDDAVKDLIEMELKQREKEGDVEVFEVG